MDGAIKYSDLDNHNNIYDLHCQATFPAFGGWSGWEVRGGQWLSVKQEGWSI